MFFKNPGCVSVSKCRIGYFLSPSSLPDFSAAAAARRASALCLLSLAFLSVRYHHATAHTATKHAAINMMPIWLIKYSICTPYSPAVPSQAKPCISFFYEKNEYVKIAGTVCRARDHVFTLAILLSCLAECSESSCVVDSHLGKHLAVDLDACLLEAVHELAVGDAVSS